MDEKEQTVGNNPHNCILGQKWAKEDSAQKKFSPAAP